MRNASSATVIVSVMMPVYNGQKYLSEAIESILNQTFTDFEFIIINDGSTDRTEEIILSYADHRIIYVKNEENLQIVKTLNKGILLAKGKYIARMDADDISLPTRLEKQITFMRENPHIDILGTWFETFGRKKYIQKLPTEHEQIKSDILFYTPLAHPAIFAKSEVLKQYKYPENYPKAEDYALWTQLISRFQFSNIPEVLLLYRLHDHQASSYPSFEQLDSSVKAANQFLIHFCDKFSKEDMAIHGEIITRKAISLDTLEEWLLKLLTANKKSHFFAEHALRESAFLIWRAQCTLPRKNSIKVINKFYSSPLFLKKRLSFFEHVKCGIKILIGIK